MSPISVRSAAFPVVAQSAASEAARLAVAEVASDKQYSKLELGRIGAYWVFYQLARLKQCGVKVDELFDYDIITSRNRRVEVKTSTYKARSKSYKTKNGAVKSYSWNCWSFLNSTDTSYYDEGIRKHKPGTRDRECDFFAFICLDDDYEVINSYIVPKKIIGTRKNIVIGEKAGGRLERYKNRWDLLK
jgi:hypothetical protein